MISSIQIKSRDFSQDLYTGEARESFAFVKFLLTSLESKGLSSTLHDRPPRQIDIPAALEYSKRKYDRLHEREAQEHSRKYAKWKAEARLFDSTYEHIVERYESHLISDKEKDREIRHLGPAPIEPTWTPPIVADFTSHHQKIYDSIQANAQRADEQASVALGHIKAHCSQDVLLNCNKIFEAENTPTREKLLAMWHWIKQRRRSDPKVVSKVQDDMKHLPEVHDWNQAVDNIHSMKILQEELSTMDAAMSDRDLIITHLRFLTDNPTFQNLKVKYGHTEQSTESLSEPTFRVRLPDGSLAFPTPTSAASSAPHTWKAYITEVTSYKMSLKDSQPKSVLHAATDEPIPKALAATTDHSLRSIIVDTVKEALKELTPAKTDRRNRFLDKNPNHPGNYRPRYPPLQPPHPYAPFTHPPSQYTQFQHPNPFFPRTPPPFPFAQPRQNRDRPPHPQNQHAGTLPQPPRKDPPQPNQEIRQPPPRPPIQQGRRAYEATAEQYLPVTPPFYDPFVYSAMVSPYNMYLTPPPMMDPSLYMAASAMSFQPPMLDHSYTDLAAFPAHYPEAPHDYSSDEKDS